MTRRLSTEFLKLYPSGKLKHKRKLLKLNLKNSSMPRRGLVFSFQVNYKSFDSEFRHSKIYYYKEKLRFQVIYVVYSKVML